MFRKILIANRGEIACRVAATARRMAIRTVAVYSDADAHAKHVQACDEAVHIGGSAPKASYLRWERIIEAAKATGAEAIHPGYGFLSEHAGFAEACRDAGIVFVGPGIEALEVMGDKIRAKLHVAASGVPTVPGISAGVRCVRAPGDGVRWSTSVAEPTSNTVPAPSTPRSPGASFRPWTPVPLVLPRSSTVIRPDTVRSACLRLTEGSSITTSHSGTRPST